MQDKRPSVKNPKVVFDDSQPGNRRVVCKEDIKEGELIIEEWFEMSAMYSEHIDRACHYCFEEMDTPLRCSNCKYAHYCGKDHQLADWRSGHKKECELVKKVSHDAQKKPTAPLVMVLKLFAQLELLNNQALLANVKSLKSHRDAITEERYEELKNNVILVIKYADENFDLERIDKYVHFLDSILTNGVTIYGRSSSAVSLAMGLLKDFCRINHSCQPNCFSGYNPTTGMRIVSARAITKGEEITFSYINNIDRVEQRRKNLKQNYYFDCQCPKCLEELNDPSICKSRKLKDHEINMQLDTAEVAMQHLQAMGAKLEEYDYEWFLLLENVEGVLVFFKEFEYLYSLRKKFTSKFECWFKGIMLNPIVGQHFNNLGRLANQLGDAQMTYDYCSRAISIFKKYFTGHLMEELEVMVDDSRTFLEFQKTKQIT